MTNPLLYGAVELTRRTLPDAERAGRSAGMDWGQYVAAIRTESSALVAAASRALDPAVPSCPGWTVRDLVGHVGAVHRAKTHLLQTGRNVEESEIEVPSEKLLQWFRDGAEALSETLSTLEPRSPAWTWDETNHTVGFWYRRMAHETLIHRVDAELAVGDLGPVDPELAMDGVDELLMVFLEGHPDWADLRHGDRYLTVRAGDRDWNFRLDRWEGTTPSGRVFEDMPAWTALADVTESEADCIVSGTPQDLDLWLWGRGQLSDLTVTGDESIAAELRTDAADNTQ